MKPHLLHLLSLLLIITGLPAGTCLATDSKSQVQLALHKLYQFRFLDADSIISELETKHASDYIPAMARASYHWWSMISQEQNAEIRADYISNLLHAEQLINASSPNHLRDEQLFFLIHVHAYQLRLELMQGDYFRAYRNLNKSIRHIGASLGREEEYPAFLLTSGLYNYMTEYIRINHPLFRFYLLLHPRGSMPLGLKHLQMAADQDDEVLHTEARYFLMRIYLDLEDRPEKAMDYASWLTEMYPENLIYLYYHHHIASVLSMPDLVSVLEKKYFKALDYNRQLNTEQRAYFKNLLQPEFLE